MLWQSIPMENMKIHSWKPEADGSFSGESLISLLEGQGYSCSTYHYPPGTFFPAHEHAIDKIDGVISGEFQICMDGETVILHAGEYIHVPAGMKHTARVLGSVPVISVDAAKTG